MFIENYKDGLQYIIDLNIKGRFFVEEYATILLTRILTPFPTGFMDLQLPAGVGISGVIYDYDGNFIYRNFPFVVHIAFMQMETTGYANENIESLWIDPFDYNSELEKAINILYDRDLNVSIYNSQLCILPENIRHLARQSISTWKNIYLPICENCSQKEFCPGFFASSLNFHSKNLKPI